MKLSKIKFKKAYYALGGAIKTLAKNAFLTFMVIFLLVLLSGGIIFYKYSFLAERGKIEPREKPLVLKKDIYNHIIQIWQEREKRFQDAGLKSRVNPFLVPLTGPATSTKIDQIDILK